MDEAYRSMSVYYGDLHNHCEVGYGHGSLEDAYQNARMQLDFVCVTPHAHWGDLPEGEGRLAGLVDYHKEGFQRSRQAWQAVRSMVDTEYIPGKFVTFLGFEWHSIAHGDRNIVLKGSQGEILGAETLAELHEELRRLASQGIEGFAFAHHIGYKKGYRGINWETFDPAYSPLVEIMSMHGASEGNETAYPYLHTMGPRDWQSTYQYGLAQGHLVGAMGSTDHHSAHPGSYGHGRMAAWASELTRDGIWDAIKNRRTYALTGDRIDIRFALNGYPLGSLAPYAKERSIELDVRGAGAIDYVELVYNNRPVCRWNGQTALAQPGDPVKVYVELGWGPRGKNVDWNGELEVIGAQLLGVEPHFRGPEVLAPDPDATHECAFSRWDKVSPGCVRFQTRTWSNLTTTTASTQGLVLELSGEPHSRIRGTFNGVEVEMPLSDLIQGSRTGYLGGFMTPAYCFHQAVPENAYSARFKFEHQPDSTGRDWYYLRVRQVNNQWAWTSPIWVEAAP
jgi:hypothetical protein